MNVVTFGWDWGKSKKPRQPDPPPRVYGSEDLQKTVKSAEHIVMSKQYGVYDLKTEFSAAQILLLRDLNTKVAQIMSQKDSSRPNSEPPRH